MRKTVIGVMGASVVDRAGPDGARRVGELVAERGAVLLCGGRGGVMEAAAAGAQARGGWTIGVLPGASAAETPPNAHIDVALFTGLGEGRNWINVCASDALIAIARGWGTLSEIALARKAGKPVILLDSWPLDDVPRAATPEEAVSWAFEAISDDGR